MPSDVLDYVRSKDPAFDDVPDDQLTRYVAARQPEFLQDPQFKSYYEYLGAQAATKSAGVAVGATEDVLKTLDVAGRGTIADEQSQTKLMADPLHPEQMNTPPEFSEIGPTSLVKSGAAIEAGKHLDEPLFNLVNPLSDYERSQLTPEQQGVFESVKENANQLTTTKNLLLLGSSLGVASLGKIAARAVALGFAAMMGKQVPEIAAQLGEEYALPEAQRDKEKIAKLITDGAIATGFSALSGLHGVSEPIQSRLGSAPVERTDIGTIDVSKFPESTLTPQTARAYEGIKPITGGEGTAKIDTATAPQSEATLAPLTAAASKETPTPGAAQENPAIGTTAGDINAAFGGLAKGAGEAFRKRLEDQVAAGEQPTYTKPEAIKLIKADPTLEWKENPDGSISVTAVKNPILEQQTGLTGMGGAVPSEFAPEGGTASSNKNAVVDAERATRGLPEMMGALKKTWGDAWTKAMAKIDEDPSYQDRLIGELKDKPRPLEDWENAALLQRRVDLNNEYDKATRDAAEHYKNGYDIGTVEAKQRIALWSDKLSELDSVTKSVGTESGRSLAARKMMMDEDFTLAKLETQLRASKNFEPLTDTERADLKKIADDYKEKADAAEKSLAAEKERQSQVASEEAHKTVTEGASDIGKVKSLTQRIIDTLEKEANESRKYLSGKVFSLSPDVLYHLSKIGALEIGKGAVELGAWSARMVKEFGEKIKPHLDEVWKRSNELLDKYAEKTAGAKFADEVKRAVRGTADTIDNLKEKIKAKVVDDKLDEIGPYVQRIARRLVAAGVKDRETLIGKVHDILKEFKPDITRRETMDAISGYGQFKQLTKDQISVQLRDLKGQMQQVGKLEDMQAKKAPLKTGVERRAPSDEERRLIKLVNEAKKKGGFTVTDPARQLATSLTARKTYLRNRLTDLKAEIDARQKLIKQKTPSPTDPELEKLKVEYEKVKADHAAMFPKGPMTDAQRIAVANRSLDREISQLESDLNAGTLNRPKGKPPIETPELNEKRAWLQALREHRQELRDIENPKKTPEERANQAFKTRTANRIAELESKMARGDFSPKTRTPTVLDAEAQAAKAKLEDVKKRFDDMKLHAEFKNRTPWEKVMDWGPKYKRFGVLSSPMVIPKLISAGLQRLISLPLEELAGEALGRIPGISEISKGAPLEGGGVHWAAERAGWKAAFTNGLSDAWQIVKSGHSDLDAIYGKPRDSYTGESELASKLLAFPGRLHGLIKAPIKRAAFERAVVRLGDFYHNQGLDLTDPLVKTRIGIEAYEAANRSIFLQNNVIASKVSNFFSEVKDKSTGHATVGSKILATAGRMELPIVKVPTNIVAETFQYIGGSASGGIRLLRALSRGAEKLRPEEKDLIMRELKKGSLGFAVLLLGYFNADVVGGYYQPKQKHGPKFGTILIYGQEIPSYLLHNPLLETLQFGATIRHVADSLLRKKDAQPQGTGAGIMAATLGLTEEVPIIRQMAELHKLSDPFQRERFLGEQAKSLLVPSIVQKAAEWTDTAKGRAPTTVLQHIETGIPGLRQNVPVDTKKK